jgi:hypothetical protein
MEEIVIKYLDKQYRFSLSTLSSYKLYDKINKSDVYLTSIWDDMETVFGISREAFEPIWDKWADAKITELNNRITDIRYKLHELNGGDINISAADINTLLMSEIG